MPMVTMSIRHDEPAHLAAFPVADESSLSVMKTILPFAEQHESLGAEDARLVGQRRLALIGDQPGGVSIPHAGGVGHAPGVVGDLRWRVVGRKMSVVVPGIGPESGAKAVERGAALGFALNRRLLSPRLALVLELVRETVFLPGARSHQLSGA